MIRVIDAICGSGKSTWAFSHMRENIESRWIFVSPYLSEVGDGTTKGRIQTELPEVDFKSPQGNKTIDFLRLIRKGHNVAISHKLFTGFSSEVAVALKEGEYNLIIDETIDMVSFYEDIPSEDVLVLIRAGMVMSDDKGKLSWNHQTFPNYQGRDKRIKELCDLECLWLYGNDVLIQRIPPVCMQSCVSTTILTYLWEGSLMYCWMQINEIDWEYYNPPNLRTNKEIKEIIREKIHLIHPPKLVKDIQRTHYGAPIESTFSVSWYQNNENSLEALKKSIETTLKEEMGRGNVFWTTFKAYENELSGVGYMRAKKVNGVLRKPFVPKNMRASNEYRDCTNCIYTINIYPHGSLENHLRGFGVTLDRDLFALSELIQFIFRGSVREHKDMNLYILSDRMRNLLKGWLEEEY